LVFVCQVQLTQAKKEEILNEYKKRITSLSLEDVLEKTGEIIATLTHYAAIVSFPDWDDRFIFTGLSNIIQQPEFADKEKIAHSHQTAGRKTPAS